MGTNNKTNSNDTTQDFLVSIFALSLIFISILSVSEKLVKENNPHKKNMGIARYVFIVLLVVSLLSLVIKNPGILSLDL